MPSYTYECPECSCEQEKFMSISEFEKFSLVCPNCSDVMMINVITAAPYFRIGGDGSDRQLSSMKQSFKQRFLKKEIDDVRHKHGVAVDDALRGGAVERIKNGD